MVAVVSLRNGDFCTSDEIRHQCSKLAPHYLVPRVVHLRKELPNATFVKAKNILELLLEHGPSHTVNMSWERCLRTVVTYRSTD